MKILFMTTVMLLQLLPLWVKSQEKSMEQQNFEYDFNRQMRLSFPARLIPDSASISFVTMLVTIQNGKVIGDPAFSDNTDYQVKMALRGEKSVIENTHWRMIFPTIDEKKKFQLLIPFGYARMSSDKQINSLRFNQIITKAFSTAHAIKYPVFILPVFWVGYNSLN